MEDLSLPAGQEGPERCGGTEEEAALITTKPLQSELFSIYFSEFSTREACGAAPPFSIMGGGRRAARWAPGQVGGVGGAQVGAPEHHSHQLQHHQERRARSRAEVPLTSSSTAEEK